MEHLFTSGLCFYLWIFPFLVEARQPINFNKDSLDSRQKLYSVFLIGDIGIPNRQPKSRVLELIQSQLNEAGANASIVFLGNTFPPEIALSDKKSFDTQTQVLQLLSTSTVKKIFIPGNQEWDKGKRKGWEYLQQREKLIEEQVKNENVFLPDGGCPGPVEVPLNDQVTLIVIDTQWWLHPWDKPGQESDCESKDASEMLLQLEDILYRNKHKRVVIAGHHPMYSYGENGGYSPAKWHLFPFTALHKSLYLPMPVVGSVYPLYRKVLGNPQEIPHPRYLIQRKALTELLSRHPNVIYANGHEHSLQYIRKDSVHYITSGAGSTTSYLKNKPKGDMIFGTTKQGFARLDFEENGEAYLSFWVVEAGEAPARRVYHEKIISDKVKKLDEIRFRGQVPKDTLITIQASDRYGASRLRTRLLGKNYRSVWQEPVKVRIFDIEREKGGLTIIKRGGGLQTKSLRLIARDGKEYVLRSVDKYIEKAIPKALHRTLAADVVQDQISASHPYAALVVSFLADKAGIYAANPQLVYVPDDPRLGNYQALFAHTLCILEERPEEELNEEAEGQEKIYSTTKMLSKLNMDKANKVNQFEVLRARLFDMLIGDWDRHDGQWRWLGKKQMQGTLFYPLPRDRDQVFFVNQGILPRIASRKWILPKFQGFDYRIRDIAGFNYNARYFDRSFLYGLTLSDWLSMADTLQTLLTDQIIEQAVGEWPEQIQALSGKEVTAKLKSRREHLKKDAQTYYKFLSKEVTIPGSEKEEYFQVERLNDKQTSLKIFKLDKAHQIQELSYQRIFDCRETREIRLYGLGGDDKFTINGQVKQSVKVRIIGGKGQDTVIDNSLVGGTSKKTYVYDTKKGNLLTLNKEGKNMTSYNESVNEYNRMEFQYDYLGPLASVQFNPDDGLFLGGGAVYRTHGFRKIPFSTQQTLTGNFAFATHAYNIDYKGEFTDVIRSLDLEANVEVMGPNFVNNFFGFGNESAYNEQEQKISYYRARVRSIRLNTLLIKNIFRTQKLFIGPAFETYQVENTLGRFISRTDQNGLDAAAIFRQKNYTGIKLGFLFDTRDNPMLPANGTYWHMESSFFKGINEFSGDYAKIESALSFFWSFRLPAKVTLATRFGGGINFGDYEFFQANTLGGLTNLRGYRRTRFTGRSSLYNNTEIRLRLFSFRTYLFPAQVGLMGFHDVGRVWQSGENSDTWHNSAGGGIWLAPFNRAVVSFMYGISKEDRLPLLRVGFLF